MRYEWQPFILLWEIDGYVTTATMWNNSNIDRQCKGGIEIVDSFCPTDYSFVRANYGFYSYGPICMSTLTLPASVINNNTVIRCGTHALQCPGNITWSPGITLQLEGAHSAVLLTI